VSMRVEPNRLSVPQRHAGGPHRQTNESSAKTMPAVRPARAAGFYTWASVERELLAKRLDLALDLA
jgi:hypothetical protein